jgi:rhamnose utilization protein RhaD (predicted bifunctional aldolase and dehydrogenase)
LNGRILVTTNLAGSWATLTNFAGGNTNITITDPAATNAVQRFYRAVIP